MFSSGGGEVLGGVTGGEGVLDDNGSPILIK
jgi:hypothetical protein